LINMNSHIKYFMHL